MTTADAGALEEAARARPAGLGGRRSRQAAAVTRRLLALAAAVLGSLLHVPAGAGAALVDEVAMFAGTDAGAPDFGHGGGAGNVFPGAIGGPFGMVQFSPDTVPRDVNYAGAYTYSDTKIRGFSLKHMSGGGCPYYGDLPITPTTDAMTESPVKANSEDMLERFVPTFSHEHEAASPGDYRVTLDPGTPEAIEVELTATLRSALARFTFPPGAQGTVLLNAGGSLMANSEAQVHVDPQRWEVSGSSESAGFCYFLSLYRIYFVARFDRPFAQFGTWRDQTLMPGATDAADESPIARTNPLAASYFPIPGLPPSRPGNPSQTAQAGAYVTFGASERRPVAVRVGVSFVSVEKARANLAAEAGERPFAALRAAARAQWEGALRRIEIRGGSARDRRVFYTSLYRTLIAPSIFSDADGEYRGFDGQVHRAEGWTKYADFDTWGINKTQWPLLLMTQPQRVGDMARSLLADAQQSGWLPKWPVANDHTNVMVGDSAALLLAHAWAMGVHSFDGAAALRAMVKGATQPGKDPGGYLERPALAEYLRLGYVPHELNADIFVATLFNDRPWGSASTTLEYAFDDFAIARMAAAQGDWDTCRAFAQRSANWRHLFDPASPYARPRSATGPFVGSGGVEQDGFVEGNSAQWTWYVPHDLTGLFDAIGGRARALERLRDYFSELNAGPASPRAYYGNQPSHTYHWYFNWLGAPAETQRIARRVATELISPTPTGYPGNEDMGSMSSLHLLAALGLAPALPGTDVVALASPLFPRVRIRRTQGDIVISAPRAAPSRPYVTALRVNRRPYGRPWLRWRMLARGGRLDFRLAKRPSSWGRGAGSAPPSFPPDAVCGR